MDLTGLNTYTDYITSQDNTANRLSDAMDKTDYKKASEDELLSACKDFEAYFLEQVFKEMQKTVDVFKDEDSTSNYSEGMTGFFKDQALQELSSLSTDKQGLGLAQTLYEQMKRNYDL